jgi:hypothetical protein
MHFCAAMVRVAGDKDQVVFRDEFNPISWPEVELLRSIHGDDAVYEVKPFARVDQSSRDERSRLVLRYGREYVDLAFGQGRGAAIEMEAAEADIEPGKTWKNPLTQLEETIDGGDGPATAPEPVKSRNSKGVFVKQPEAGL